MFIEKSGFQKFHLNMYFPSLATELSRYRLKFRLIQRPPDPTFSPPIDRFLVARSATAVSKQRSKLRFLVNIGPSRPPAFTGPSFDLHHPCTFSYVSSFLFLCSRGFVTRRPCTLLSHFSFVLLALGFTSG